MIDLSTKGKENTIRLFIKTIENDKTIERFNLLKEEGSERKEEMNRISREVI